MQRRVSDFVINYLSNSQKSDGRETKRYNLGKKSFCKMFDTFGNLVTDFGINRSKYLWAAINNFEVILFLVKVLTH